MSPLLLLKGPHKQASMLNMLTADASQAALHSSGRLSKKTLRMGGLRLPEIEQAQMEEDVECSTISGSAQLVT